MVVIRAALIVHPGIAVVPLVYIIAAVLRIVRVHPLIVTPISTVHQVILPPAIPALRAIAHMLVLSRTMVWAVSIMTRVKKGAG